LYYNSRKEKTDIRAQVQRSLEDGQVTEYSHASFNVLTPLESHAELSCLCQPEDLQWHSALSNTGLRLIQKGVCSLLMSISFLMHLLCLSNQVLT